MSPIFFIDGMEDNPMGNAEWWFLMSPMQKRQHLYVDSKVSDAQIKLILDTYGEEEEDLEEAEV